MLTTLVVLTGSMQRPNKGTHQLKTMYGQISSTVDANGKAQCVLNTRKLIMSWNTFQANLELFCSPDQMLQAVGGGWRQQGDWRSLFVAAELPEIRVPLWALWWLGASGSITVSAHFSWVRASARYWEVFWTLLQLHFKAEHRNQEGQTVFGKKFRANTAT